MMITTDTCGRTNSGQVNQAQDLEAFMCEMLLMKELLQDLRRMNFDNLKIEDIVQHILSPQIIAKYPEQYIYI